MAHISKKSSQDIDPTKQAHADAIVNIVDLLEPAIAERYRKWRPWIRTMEYMSTVVLAIPYTFDWYLDWRYTPLKRGLLNGSVVLAIALLMTAMLVDRRMTRGVSDLGHTLLTPPRIIRGLISIGLMIGHDHIYANWMS